MDFVQQLAATEQLRMTLAQSLGAEQRIDLIDLPTAWLAMRAVVAEEGLPVIGGDGVHWSVFCSGLGESLRSSTGNTSMRLDLYQAETALIAQEQSVLLDEARAALLSGRTLSR